MSGPRRLLIVEDDRGLQRQLRWQLEAFELLQAGDRAEALSLLRARAPAVVLLDLGLPPDPAGVSEGFLALEQILAERPTTRVVVMTGRDGREHALRAIAAGALDFHAKPVDVEMLHLVLERAFFVSALEAEARAAEAAGHRPALPRGDRREPDAARRLSDDRAGGAGRGERADHRRERHRQGGDGPCPAPAVPPTGRPVRGDQLRRDPAEPARGRAVRLRAWCLHGCLEADARPTRARPWRHPLPRRDRRLAGRVAGQAPPLRAGAGDRAARWARGDPSRPADRLRHPPRPAARDAGGPVPRGPLLPARRDRGRTPAAARPPGRCRVDRPPPARDLRARAGPAGGRARRRCGAGDRAVSLARQRPRAAEPAQARRAARRGSADRRCRPRPPRERRRGRTPRVAPGARASRAGGAPARAGPHRRQHLAGRGALGISRPTLYDLLRQHRLRD